MMRSNVPVWREAVLALLLVVPVGPETLAQKAALGDCPFLVHSTAGYSKNNSPWLAQLDEQPESSDFRLGRGYARDQARKGAYDRARDHVRQQMGRRFDKHIEQFRILKLLELLDLQENQELDFITVFHKMRRERRLLRESRTRLVGELAKGLRAETVSDDEINRLIREISELGRQEGQVMEDFLTEAREILTPQQLGRFLVFQERFEFELLEAVKSFQQRRQGPLGPMKPEKPTLNEFEGKDSF